MKLSGPGLLCVGGFLITDSVSLLFMTHCPFLPDSVLVGCVFIGSYPFFSDMQFVHLFCFVFSFSLFLSFFLFIFYPFYKHLCGGLTFNRLQWESYSATYETLTHNVPQECEVWCKRGGSICIYSHTPCPRTRALHTLMGVPTHGSDRVLYVGCRVSRGPAIPGQPRLPRWCCSAAVLFCLGSIQICNSLEYNSLW